MWQKAASLSSVSVAGEPHQHFIATAQQYSMANGCYLALPQETDVPGAAEALAGAKEVGAGALGHQLHMA